MNKKIGAWLLATTTIVVSCQEQDHKTTTDNPQHEVVTKTISKNTALMDPEKIDIQYPTTKKVVVEEDYFGTKVQDPYRWLEESVSDDKDADINKWVDAQSKLANNYLQNIPQRAALEKRLTKLMNYERYSAPFKEGKNLYFYKNTGLQAQSILYTQEKWDSEPVVFIDPNTFSKDGSVSLGGVSFSSDGKYAAYATSASGSDWRSVAIKETATGKLLSDKVDWIRYSGISWYQDGFFYSRYSESASKDKHTQENEFHQVYYHKVGTEQAADQLIFADRSYPKRLHGVEVTEDEQFWVLSVSESTSGNALYYKKAASKNEDFIPIVEDLKNDYNVIGNIGDKLLVYTNYQAPKYQLIAIDVNNPAPKNWEPVIRQTDNVLNDVRIIGGRLVAKYTKEITHLLSVYEMNGTYVGDVKLPNLIGVGAPVSLSGAVGKKDDAEAYFSMSSFILPNTICKFDVKTMETTVWRSSKVDFDPKDFQIEYVQYQSKDGTKVPMSIVYKKGVRRDGNNPTLLYGYGGFNVSLMPSFSVKRLPFLEKGGIYAVANIRGGGEKGKNWHEAGTKLKKQNVFDDFIAASEYLISEKYTAANKLAIEGGSNGGLLVGACMTQRPELYKVALPIVGVLDMMHYHEFTIGAAWAEDYGRSDDETQYKNLLKYSPVHNVKAIAYPATMIMTADHDDRVVPAHSFKFAAQLQAKHTGKTPILLRIDQKAGHGAGKSTQAQIGEEADKLAFLMFNLGMK